ncbi:MAG: hypothetical protein BroJett040_16190 [Oligoflexia bacterium]|nr:MAG: hypothetical protein BroJett040_16190 [Oligoflexia bacterium]
MRAIFVLVLLASVLAQAQSKTAAAPWPFPGDERKPKAGFLASKIASCQADDPSAIGFPGHSYNEETPYRIQSVDLITTDDAHLGLHMNLTTAKGLQTSMMVFTRLASSQGNTSVSVYRAPSSAHHLDEVVVKMEANQEGTQAKLTINIKTNQWKQATTTYQCRLLNK